MKKVLLGIPHGGQLAPGVLQTVLHAVAQEDVLETSMVISDAGGSLAVRNFNMLWALALNMHAKGDCDYFAMAHSDIHAAPGWLSTLLREMDLVGADVISAVVALKDYRGLTTTGTAGVGQTQVKRLSLKEIARLPTTFGIRDLQEAGLDGSSPSDTAPRNLMVNTGLWVADMRPSFWRASEVDGRKLGPVCFKILDWIQRAPDAEDGTPGEYSGMVFSEDWFWSHEIADRGAKVFATSAVKIQHRGVIDFESPNPKWGAWETDLGDREKFERTAEPAADGGS